MRAGLLAALAGLGCRSSEEEPSVASAAKAVAASSASQATGGAGAAKATTATSAREDVAPAPGASPTQPLVPSDSPWLMSLAEGDVVALPVGAREPRPVMIAVHGATGRPEWVCGAARAMFGPYPMVVCPRAAGKGASFSWSSGASIAVASARALAAAEVQWGAAMRPEGRVWMTYSQSAMLMAGAAEHPQLPNFSRALLWEGVPSSAALSAAARGLQAHGVETVRVVAAQAGNRGPAEQTAERLRRAGLQAELVYLGSVGHFFTPKHTQAGRAALERLFGGMPEWQPVLAHGQSSP